MTNLHYNGVVLQNVLTRKFSQTVKMDPSDTDLEHHHFTIRVVSYVTSSQRQLVLNAPGKLGVGLQAFMTVVENEYEMRKKLMEPRGIFAFAVGGKTLLRADPTGVDGPVDVEHGPHPRSCDITYIHGKNLMRVEFEIEVDIMECVSPAPNGGVLSNRWSLTDRYNEDFDRTRTLHGRLRVQNSRFNPQLFRKLMIPALQSGFKRTAIDIVADRKGLEIEYTVTDQEVYAAPPGGATRWECVESTHSDDYGTNWFHDISLTVYGSKTMERQNLAWIACAVAQERLEIGQVQKDKSATVLPTSFAVIDYLHENRVEVRATVFLNVTRTLSEIADAGGMPMPTAFIGKHIQDSNFVLGQFAGEAYDRNVHWDGLTAPLDVTSDESLAGLFVCYLQSPCDPRHGVPVLETEAPPDEKKKPPKKYPPPKVNTSPGVLPPADLLGLNTSELKRAIYSSYKVETDYRTQQNAVQIPIAQSVRLTSQQQNPKTAFVVTMAPPTAKRILIVTATSIGNWPKLPRISPAKIGGVDIQLIGETQVAARTPVLLNDGKTRQYEARVEYEYSLSRAPKDNEKLVLGKIPWDSTKADDNFIPAEIFDPKLISGSQTHAIAPA